MNKYSSCIYLFFLTLGILVVPQVCRADLIAGFLLIFPPLFFIFASLGIITIEAWIIAMRLREKGRKSLLISFIANSITALIGALLYYSVDVWLADNEIIMDFLQKYWFCWIFIFLIGTFLLEVLILRLFFREKTWKSLLQTSAIMNILSYIFIPVLLLADSFFIGSIIIVSFLILAFLHLFFERKVQEMNRTKTRRLVLLLIVVIVVNMVLGLFSFIDIKRDNAYRMKAKYARIESDLTTMHTEAIIIWLDNEDNGGYSLLSCDYNDKMKELCEDIKKASGAYPVIHASKDRYCVYVKPIFSRDLWFCLDNKSTLRRTTIDPGSSGYCDGNTFICPPSGE